MVCIGLGGWPCGYAGPFTGSYYAGYATIGCTPAYPNGTCAVPQVAMETSYLVIRNASYVIDWANQSSQPSSRLVDGSTLSVLGRLDVIFYNKTAGSMYMIYYSNSKGLWNPQPQLQIENGTLTTASSTITCATTVGSTLSGPPTAVWNPSMIPAGACYAIYEMPQQEPQTTGNMDIASWTVLVASCAVAVVMVGTIACLRLRMTRSNP